MKYHKCEWCENVADRKYMAKNSNYVRYACCADHGEQVETMLDVDGIKEWTFRISSEPFKIEKTPANGLG